MNKTAKNLAYFSIAVAFVKVIGALTMFLVAHILSPGDYGTWITVLVIGSFSSIVCLGTIESLIKLFPFFSGQGEAEKARALESNVFGSIFLSAAVLIVLGLLFPLFATTTKLLSFTFIIRIMVIAASVSMFSAFYYYRFMAHQDFRLVGIIDSARSLSLFCLIVPFSYFWSLNGAVIAIAVNEICILGISIAMNKKTLGAVPPSFDIQQLKYLIGVGFPITIIWWAYMFQTTIDRVLCMAMLGKQATGWYGLGASIVSALVLVPMILGRVLYPKVNEEIGKNASQNTISEYVIMPARLLGLALPLIIGTLFILTPDVYKLFFSKYMPGAMSAKILLLGAYFICLIRSGVNYLVAIDKQNNVLLYVVASLGLNIGMCYGLVRLHMGIEGIAIGLSVSGFVLTTLIWRSVFKELALPFMAQLREIFFLYLPFVLCAILVFFAPLFQHSLPRHLPSLLGNSMAAAAFTVAYIAIILVVPPLNLWSKGLILRIRTTVLRRS